MSSSWRRFLCLALMTVLVLGKAAYAIEAHGMAHAIEQGEHHAFEAGGHEHSQPSGDLDHDVLHAPAHAQAAMTTVTPSCDLVPTVFFVAKAAQARAPAKQALEPPLRPPRATA